MNECFVCHFGQVREFRCRIMSNSFCNDNFVCRSSLLLFFPLFYLFVNLSLSLSHTHTHTLSLSLSHTHTLSLSHTHTHSLSLHLSAPYDKKGLQYIQSTAAATKRGPKIKAFPNVPACKTNPKAKRHVIPNNKQKQIDQEKVDCVCVCVCVCVLLN